MKIIDNINSFFSRIKAKIAAHLIEDVALWHKMWSMRVYLLITAYTTAAGAWLVIPVDWKPELSNPEKYGLAGFGVLLPVIGMLVRVLKQSPTTKSTPDVTVPPPKGDA
jgi:hypothetical protein